LYSSDNTKNTILSFYISKYKVEIILFTDKYFLNNMSLECILGPGCTLGNKKIPFSLFFILQSKN